MSSWVAVAVGLAVVASPPQEAADPSLLGPSPPPVAAASAVLEGGLHLVADCQLNQVQLSLDGVGWSGSWITTDIKDPDSLRSVGWRRLGGSGPWLSERPVEMIRVLLEKDVLQLSRTGTDGAAIETEVRASSLRAGLGEVLAACGQSLVVDPGALRSEPDPTLIGTYTITMMSPLEYPERALARGINDGFVLLSCKASRTGVLQDCLIESEFPRGNSFGMSASAAARRSRVTPVLPAGETIHLRIGFRVPE